MFLVTGALAGAAILLVGALVVITSASATPDAVEPEVLGPNVVTRAETGADFAQRRVEAAAARPAAARELLDGLSEPSPMPEDLAPFSVDLWVSEPDGCLSIDERVLIARSSVDVTFVDQLECVPNGGLWIDPWLGGSITRALGADIVLHIPAERVWASGGWKWTAATRAAYVADLDHPATLQVVTAESGHNPRSQGPARWKPAREQTWCAYAVDWIEVSHRWDLGVSEPERSALLEMLDTCDNPASDGANPITTTLDEPALPAIGLIESST